MLMGMQAAARWAGPGDIVGVGDIGGGAEGADADMLSHVVDWTGGVAGVKDLRSVMRLAGGVIGRNCR